MSGGLGGSQSTQVELPQWLDQFSQQLAQRAGNTMRIGHQGYEGPSVAEFTPMQNAAFQGVNQAAQAFGMPAVGDPNVGGHGGLDGMTEAKNFGGVWGYGPGQGFNRAVNQWRQGSPSQAQAYNALFVPRGRPQGNGNRRGGK